MRNACIAFLLVAAACTGDESTPATRGDDAPAPEPSVTGAPARPASGWDESAGPVLLVAGEQPDEAYVIYPHVQGDAGPDTVEVTDHAGAAATLVGRGGVTGTVVLGDAAPPTDDTACTPWPRLSAPGVSTPWTVGFVRPGIEAIATESLHAMAPRDSARFVADVARMASTLAGTRREEGQARFHGLPFVVKDAGVFTAAPLQVGVAHVVRRINQEANPLEEHTLLVLERRGPGDQWRIAYSDHSVGPEETVRREELLAAVRVGGALTLVLALDDGSGVRYAFVQRGASGGWRQTWVSAPAGC